MRSSFAPILALVGAAAAATHQVAVGQNGALRFVPDSITAAVGDFVEFTFYPGDHSVAQGDFSTPCMRGSETGGFYSGFVNPLSGASPMVFRVEINSTDPIWYYCSQVSHCQFGMAAVINPPASGNTIDAYIAAAMGVSTSQSGSGVMGGVFALPGSGSGSSGSSSSMMMSSSSMMMASSSMMMASSSSSMMMASSSSSSMMMMSTSTPTTMMSSSMASSMVMPASTSSAEMSMSTSMMSMSMAGTTTGASVATMSKTAAGARGTSFAMEAVVALAGAVGVAALI